MNKYLFRDNHNGHYVTYQPFEVCGIISQRLANEIMLKENPGAGRTGSSIDDLLVPLDADNFIVKKYNSIYHKPGEPPFHDKTDPLPACMYMLEIIECISGSY